MKPPPCAAWQHQAGLVHLCDLGSPCCLAGHSVRAGKEPTLCVESQGPKPMAPRVWPLDLSCIWTGGGGPGRACTIGQGPPSTLLDSGAAKDVAQPRTEREELFGPMGSMTSISGNVRPRGREHRGIAPGLSFPRLLALRPSGSREGTVPRPRDKGLATDLGSRRLRA